MKAFERSILLLLGALTGLVGACSAPKPSVPWDAQPPTAQRARLLADARDYLQSSRMSVGRRRFPNDCSGFVAAVLYQNGIDVFHEAHVLGTRGNGVRLLHEYVLRHGEVFQTKTPQPGDLVFFSNSYDRNRDGQANDLFTHVGFVERVLSDGTVIFLHFLRSHVQRSVLNRQHPNRHRSPQGGIINSFLRRKHSKDSSATRYLAAGLFENYGSIVKNPQPPE